MDRSAARASELPTLRDISEKEWSAQVADLARMLNWFRYHTYRSDRSPAGFPDETLIRDRIVFLELKTETGRLSDAQRDVLTRIIHAGGEAYIARPRDLDVLANVLQTRDTTDICVEALAAITRGELGLPP